MVVDGECLVVVQCWDNFVTLHEHEEARLAFIRLNANRPDFYGSGNRRLESYVGVVDEKTWRSVRTVGDIRHPEAPPKWTLRKGK